MKHSLLLLVPVLLTISCSASSSSSENTEYEVVLKFVNVDDNDPANKELNYSKTVKVSLGSASLARYYFDTFSQSEYLLGIYVDDTDQLVKASKLYSFDNSFSSLTFKTGLKLNNPNYIDSFNGIYRNILGDEMTIKEHIIDFNYTIREGVVVHFKTSYVSCDGKFPSDEHTNPIYTCPYFKELYFNDEKVDFSELLFAQMINIGIFSIFDDEFTWTPSILFNAFDFQFLGNMIIKQYCENNNIEYHHDGYDDTDYYSSTLHYYRANDVTINYDLKTEIDPLKILSKK